MSARLHSVLFLLVILAVEGAGVSSAMGAGFITNAPLATGRKWHTATLLPDGRLLVTGGATNYDQVYHPTSLVELYDPATHYWKAVEAMTNARAIHTATLLPNGKVLVTGGLYDPTNGKWSLTAPLNFARWDHTATLFPDGQVLIVGGSRNLATYLSSTEIYDSGFRTLTPLRLNDPEQQRNGAFTFTFTNTPGLVFSALSTTNSPLSTTDWRVVGQVSEVSSGHYRFTDNEANSHPHRFYRVRTP